MSATLLLTLTLLPIQDKTQADLVAMIVKAHHDYFEKVKDLSVAETSVQFRPDNTVGTSTMEILRDKQNLLILMFGSVHRGVEAKLPLEHPNTSATIVRVRGGSRQSLQLKRPTRLSAWILDQEAYSPTDESEYEHLFNTEKWFAEASPLGNGIRLTHAWNYPVAQVLQHPTFRLKKHSEDRSGTERLVALEYVMDTPVNPDQRSGKLPFRSGKLTLRPDHFWTVASSTGNLDEKMDGRGVVQHSLTIDYHPEADKKYLPKTVQSVSVIVDKNNLKSEKTSRSFLQYQLHAQLPADRFTLTQFGLPEREPGQGVLNPANAPGLVVPPDAEKRNFLAPSNVIPPYVVWGAGGMFVGLALGVLLPRLRRRTAKPAAPSPG